MIENSNDASRFAEIASLLKSTDPTDLSKARALTRGVLDEITSIIFEEFFRRQHLMGAIASSKREGEPILQLQREFEVISSAQQKAAEAWEDTNYAAMLMWLITASAKEKQRQILNRDSVFVPEVIDPLVLRNNAISLRNVAAASYEDY